MLHLVERIMSISIHAPRTGSDEMRLTISETR